MIDVDRTDTIILNAYFYGYDRSVCIDYNSRIAHQQDGSCNRFQQLESERAQKASMLISPACGPVRKNAAFHGDCMGWADRSS